MGKNSWTPKELKKVAKRLEVREANGDPIDLEERQGKNKLGAEPIVIDGIWFPSTKEGNYYSTLQMLKKCPDLSQRVSKFELQVPYKVSVNNIHCFTYYLDFRVTYANGRVEHIDTKGHKAGCTYNLFRLKKKCVEAQYGITIKEI